MTRQHAGKRIFFWQILFITLAATWLLAPSFNHMLSYRSSLISQYETPGQPFSAFFRFGDLAAGLLLTAFAVYRLKASSNRVIGYLLLCIGMGMVLDPIFTTSCKMQGLQCIEYTSASFFVHAVETVIVASSIFILGLYDTWRRKRIVSTLFVIFQMAYLILFATQYASHYQFQTLTQYIYQLITIVWLAWFCRDYFLGDAHATLGKNQTSTIRYVAGAWALMNGILAIVLSLTHIRLLNRIQGLYFAGNTAWLAQHGVIVGVVMFYISRHLMRGERRARQIFLVIVGMETLKYAVVTPNAGLVLLYAGTFCLLFALTDQFDRGTINLTWDIRLKDLYYMVIALLVGILLSLVILDRDNRVSIVASRSFNNFHQYALHSDQAHNTHLKSVLLADTTTTFILMSVGSVFWILFRPYKSRLGGQPDLERVQETLARFSNSSEDYFKLWPQDKQYFWNESGSGFIAYKIVGSVAFALADPIAEDNQREALISRFKAWCRARRLRACFLLIVAERLELYEDLYTMQIGASALVTSESFVQSTSSDKWWRWKRNRALKQGYRYDVHKAPYTPAFVRQLRDISDAWLSVAQHEERGFALGYFDEQYIQSCVIHTLKDHDDKIIAFANQLPVFGSKKITTIDMLRYMPEAGDAMPFLLANIIETSYMDGYSLFDLGFVPYATMKGPLLAMARVLSASRFSSEGLERFKNKFDPNWQPNYLAYDGDVADLVTVAVNLEKALKLENNS